MSDKSRYLMSFSTGGLFLDESRRLAELHSRLGDWNLVRKEARDSNLLQARTMKTHQRVFGEATKRLKDLTEKELTLFLGGTLQEQKCLLWLAICRTYAFIGDFAREVLREKVLKASPALDKGDFNVFFNQKAETHEELESLSDSTRTKLRQVLYKMLRESDMLTSSGAICHPSLTPALARLISEEDSRGFTFFPITDEEIRRWMS